MLGYLCNSSSPLISVEKIMQGSHYSLLRFQILTLQADQQIVFSVVVRMTTSVFDTE